MSEPQPTQPRDPFERWRSLRDSCMDAWSRAMVEDVNSEAYARTTGAMLDGYLTASGPYQAALEKAMTEGLKQLSVPSLADFTVMAERLTNIERRLDDFEIKLDRALAGIQAIAVMGIAAGRDAAPPEAGPAPNSHPDVGPAPVSNRRSKGTRR